MNEDEIQAEIEGEVFTKTKKSLEKFLKIWMELKIDKYQVKKRAMDLWEHVDGFLESIYKEENEYCETIKERIKNYTIKITELCKVLGMSPVESSGSLINIEENLRENLDVLTKLKYSREKAFKSLKVVESKLCQVLQIQELQLPPDTGVPTEKDISDLKQHIQMLTDERNRRHKKFLLAKKELTTILETTEFIPESSLEKDILSGTETLSLTNETFKTLEEIKIKAQKRKAEMEEKKKTLFDKLTVLWERLKIDKNVRDQFLSKHIDCKLATMQSIEKELERCENMKRANLVSFIEDLRAELVEMWGKCYVSQPERDLFHFFSSTEMSDETLEAHEAEVEKWKSYYAKTEHILKKIEKRKQLWEMMIVFESKATDPSRFHNRGGNLLQEERRRKKFQVDLPNLETSIFEDIEDLEVDGSKFIYNGEDFKTFVSNQWAERINQKDNEKAERHNKHLLQIGNEGLGKTPMKRTMKTAPNSAPSKLFKSSMGVPALRTPVPSTSKFVASTVGKIRKNKLFTPATPSILKKGQSNILTEKNKQVTSGANRTTYTDFALELNKTARYNFRSSVLAAKKTKQGGSRTSQTKKNHSKRKSEARALGKSLTKTSATLTPARGKLGLPFII